MRNQVLCSLCCIIFLVGASHRAYSQVDIGRIYKRFAASAADTQRVMLLDTLALYYRDSKADTALKFIRQGLELAQHLRYAYGEGRLRLVLAQVYGHTGNADQAFAEARHALYLFGQLHAEDGIAAAYNQLGVYEAKKANYDSAHYYIYEAQKIYEKRHDTASLAYGYMNLGVMLEEDIHQQKNLDKALEYLEKALAYCNKKTKLRLDILNDIGIVWGKKGQFKRSLGYFNIVLAETDTAAAFATVRLNALTNCVVAYDNLGDHVKSFAYAHEELRLAQKYHMVDEEILGLINVGVMETNEDTAKGLSTIRQGFELAKKIGDKRLQLQAYSNIVGVYVDKKDYKNAFLALSMQNKLESQVFNMDKAMQMNRLQATYELQKSNAQVEELKTINRKNEMQKSMILLFACIITTAFLFIMFYYRQTILLNRQLRVQKEELKQLNTVKDKLFSVIGHDLRSPVGSIVSLLSIWEADNLTEEEKKEVINHLKGQTRATLETLDKLLNWGQSQIKGISIFQTEFATKRLIKDSIELLNEQALQKGISITDNTPANLLVFADRLQIDFVIRNLLSNAIKFTHPGGDIEISTDSYAVEGFTVLKIKDTGVGISAQRQKTLFDAAGTSTDGTANEKGTNVGLKLCKEYVVSNGGKIWVESIENKGSAFCFTIKNHA